MILSSFWRSWLGRRHLWTPLFSECSSWRTWESLPRWIPHVLWNVSLNHLSNDDISVCGLAWKLFQSISNGKNQKEWQVHSISVQSDISVWDQTNIDRSSIATGCIQRPQIPLALTPLTQTSPLSNTVWLRNAWSIDNKYLLAANKSTITLFHGVNVRMQGIPPSGGGAAPPDPRWGQAPRPQSLFPTVLLVQKSAHSKSKCDISDLKKTQKL